MRTCLAISSLLLSSVLQVRGADPPSVTADPSSEQIVGDVGIPWDEASYEERQFTQRFNQLMLALRSFSQTYNTGRVIDVKRVEAVKKAWHELEKSDWFKAQKPD